MCPEPVDRRQQLARASAVRARRDRDVGVVVIGIGLVIFLVPALILFVLWRIGVVTSNATGYVLVPAIFLAMWVVGRGRRMRLGSAEGVLAADERPPIVYLRPFDVDGGLVYTAWGSRVRPSGREPYITHEERLGRALRKVGPFVAVGDPTEDLPRLGAARVYAADEDWRMTVDDLSAYAGAVLLQTGSSEGVAWEVNHVVALGAPERVILALPRADSRRKRRKLYAAFRRRFGDVFPRPLPESIGNSQFAYFDADWTPRLVERGASLPAGDTPRDLALRRLAREFKILWAPRWLRYTAYCAAVLTVGIAYQLVTGGFASSIRVDACVNAREPELRALKAPFATTDRAVHEYATADCQALEDEHLLAGGGKLASPTATRRRCERYTRALYDFEPVDRRGSRSGWGQVATAYCAASAAPDPGGTRLLRTASEVNRP